MKNDATHILGYNSKSVIFAGPVVRSLGKWMNECDVVESLVKSATKTNFFDIHIIKVWKFLVDLLVPWKQSDVHQWEGPGRHIERWVHIASGIKHGFMNIANATKTWLSTFWWKCKVNNIFRSFVNVVVKCDIQITCNKIVEFQIVEETKSLRINNEIPFWLFALQGFLQRIISVTEEKVSKFT